MIGTFSAGTCTLRILTGSRHSFHCLFHGRLIFPSSPTLSTFTFTVCPSLTKSVISFTKVGATSEICTIPVLPSPSSTKAPNFVIPVIFLQKIAPTSSCILVLVSSLNRLITCYIYKYSFSGFYKVRPVLAKRSIYSLLSFIFASKIFLSRCFSCFVLAALVS